MPTLLKYAFSAASSTTYFATYIATYIATYFATYFGRAALAGMMICAISGSLEAQPERVILNHPLASRATIPLFRQTLAATETLRVLVAMVEFQADNEPRTTGNGLFDLSQPTRHVIDPPPHDRAYAAQHMTFMQNYFFKSSGGKLFVTATLLDSVYRLQQPMAYYSPPRSSTNNAALGALVNDTWRAVDSLTPGLQFGNYQAFMIFHAGVGRDIDLASQLGYDPAPFDIPSVYLDTTGLRKIFGPSYQGVPVQGGTTYVKNSVIIPETESRSISTGLGNSLLQLGINGLIAASIGSHLGLPDLFNTKNGSSGIGRFGLMDGQAIFSWSGVFPPEPSAWEKYHLGWISPIVVGTGSSSYDLPAAVLTNGLDSVLRVPISAKEYFLVENRNRDAHRDGSTVTVVRDGVTMQKTFPRDTTYFNAFNQDSIYGVVVDVDEFDWSLPGHTNTSTGELFDGGILIWHIDENVIDANIAADAVNANPNRRGVNVMEADGSADIGQSYGLISPGFGTEEGTYRDYWYSGNSSTPRTFLNEFTPNSIPNSLSNDFANSHVYMKNFSVRGPRMGITVTIGDEQVKPMPGFPRNLGSTPGISSVLPADLDGDGVSELVVATTGKSLTSDSIPVTDGAILAFRQNGTSFRNPLDSTGFFLSEAGKSYDPPAVLDFNRDGKDDIVTARHSTSPGYTTAELRIFTPADNNGDNIPDILWGTLYGVASTAPVLPFAISVGDSAIVWGGTGRHMLLQNDTSSVHSGSLNFSGIAWSGGRENFYGLELPSALQKFDRNPVPLGTLPLGGKLSGSPAVADLDGNGTEEIVVLGADGSVNVFDSSLAKYKTFPYAGGVPITSSPAIGDLNGDGQKDIVWTAGTKIFALNAAGALLDNFPISVKTNASLTCSPVLADVDGDGRTDVLIVTKEGKFYAFNRDGNVVAGFPLQLGGDILSSVSVFRTSTGNVGIAAACEDHALYAWQLPARYDSTPHPWPMYLHDARHSGFEGTPAQVIAVNPDFMPASRAYNWPNPVTSTDGFRTHIRYYVAEDSRVTVKIFDMAGDLVAQLTSNGVGGLDNEVDWDVSGVQSGVYFGHIDAQGTASSGHAVIKIAIVR